MFNSRYYGPSGFNNELSYLKKMLQCEYLKFKNLISESFLCNQELCCFIWVTWLVDFVVFSVQDHIWASCLWTNPWCPIMETGSYHKRVLPVACRNISENVSTYCMTMKLDLTLNSFISIIWIMAVKKRGKEKHSGCQHRYHKIELKLIN